MATQTASRPFGRSGTSRLASQSRLVGAFQASGFVWPAFLLVIIFNLAIPKGGTRIEGFPITWGYMVIGLVAAIGVIGLVRRRDLSIPPIVQTLVLFLPMAIFVFYKARHLGLPASGWFHYFIIFSVLPACMLLVFAPYLEDLRSRDIGRAIQISIRIAVAWGLFNFILFLLTRNFIEIPYITVNGSEVGMTASKNNMRGSVMKLVSTFNNGNIFAVCMIMLLPIYFYFEKSRVWLGLFILAVICTLSRTAWFGMTAAFFLMILFRRIRVNRISFWLAGVGAVAVLLALLPMLGWDSDNLMNARLGGRMRYLETVQITYFGLSQLTIPEVLYFGLLQSYGLFGLVLGTAALGFGIGYGIVHWDRLNDLSKAAVLGAMSYMICAAMDAAFIFPPVIPLFLFVNGLIYRRGMRGAELHPPGNRRARA